MSARRSTWDAIADAKRRTPATTPPDDTETICVPCQGTGLDDGPDGPPCVYCEGSGVW